MATATIPQKYKQKGAEQGWNPSPLDSMGLFLIGAPGTGKTSLLASNPNAYVIDTEARASDCRSVQATYFSRLGIQEIEALIEDLVADGLAGKHPCKHVAFDTGDEFINQAIPHLSKTRNQGRDIREMMKGRGWFILRDYMCDKLRRLSLAGYGWTVSTHVVVNSFTDDEDHYIVERKPSLFNTLVGRLHCLCHIQGTLLRRVQYPVIKRTTSKGTVLELEDKNNPIDTFYLSLRPGKGGVDDETGDAKSPALGHLPDFIQIPPTDAWNALIKVYEAAIKDT